MMEENWVMIRDEALSQLNSKTGLFHPESQHLVDTGDWKQLIMFEQGSSARVGLDRPFLSRWGPD